MTASSHAATRIGIALDGTLLTAAWRGARTSTWRTHVVPCDGTARSIASAMADVAAQAPRDAEVAFTLLRPLATSRTVAFPQMKRAELETVLERDWARYAIGLRAEPHIAAARASAAVWRAAFAPVATLDALDAVARTHGWRVLDVRSADDALAAAARASMAAITRMDDVVVVLCGAAGPTDVAHLRRGIAVAGRQLLGSTAADVVAFTRRATSVAGGARIVIVGDAERGATLARELGRDGLEARHSALAHVATESPASVLASAALLQPAALPLLSQSERSARLRRAGITTRWIAAAAVVLVAAGFAIESRRIGAELETVTRERSAVASRVRDAVAARARLDGAADAAAALAEHEAGASRTSAALAGIALVLPENASLSVLQISGDSVTVEGESDRSADVYDALRGAPSLEAVRLAAPLRQERQADAEPVERFSFVARLRQGMR